MLNVKVIACSLGFFAAVSFVLCIIYGLIVPPSMHSPALLEMVFPGFKWLTFAGICVGLLESFAYGAFAGLIFVPIYNLLNRRWGTLATQ